MGGFHGGVGYGGLEGSVEAQRMVGVWGLRRFYVREDIALVAQKTKNPWPLLSFFVKFDRYLTDNSMAVHLLYTITFEISLESPYLTNQ